MVSGHPTPYPRILDIDGDITTVIMFPELMKTYSFEIALLVRLKDAKADEEVDKAFIDAIKRAAVKLGAMKNKSGFYVRFSSKTSSPPSRNAKRKNCE